MKIVLINGAPGSGKDTMGKMLEEHYNCDNGEERYEPLRAEVVKFAGVIKRAATAIYCGGDRDLFDYLDTHERKNEKQDLFLGKSCREVQIGISENFMKPFHDEGVFGKIAANEIQQLIEEETEYFFVTDSGFRQEAVELVNRFGVENVILIRLHREGYTYTGDSRSHIDLADLGVRCYDTTQIEGKPEFAFKNIINIIDKGE